MPAITPPSIWEVQYGRTLVHGKLLNLKIANATVMAGLRWASQINDVQKILTDTPTSHTMATCQIPLCAEERMDEETTLIITRVKMKVPKNSPIMFATIVTSLFLVSFFVQDMNILLSLEFALVLPILLSSRHAGLSRISARRWGSIPWKSNPLPNTVNTKIFTRDFRVLWLRGWRAWSIVRSGVVQ